MRSTRGKYGLNLIPMKLTKKYFELESESPKAIIFGSDQSPSNVKNAYWTTFLNQDTGFLFGAEKYAKDYNFPVIYVHIEKIKRGYYTVHFELITDQPKNEEHGFIITDFAKKLESNINDNPPIGMESSSLKKLNHSNLIYIHFFNFFIRMLIS